MTDGERNKYSLLDSLESSASDDSSAEHREMIRQLREMRSEQKKINDRLQNLTDSVGRVVDTQSVHKVYLPWLGKLLVRIAEELEVKPPPLLVKDEDL